MRWLQLCFVSNAGSTLLLGAVVALVAWGCGDDDGPMADGGSDAAPPTCSDDPSLELGDPDGHAEPLGASASEARAGRIDAAELPPDPAGLATWAAGDFLLANDRIAVLIEDVGLSDGYDPYGGKIVGIFRVEGGALVEPADFNEIAGAVGRFTFDATSVTVLADGSDGGEAIVRAVGPHATVPFIDPLVAGLIPGDFRDIEVAVDYVLAPGAEHVDLRYTFDSPRAVPARVSQETHFFVQYKRMPIWTPVAGFETSIEMGEVPFVAFVDDDATSFAWASPEHDLSPFIDISGVFVFAGPAFQIGPCGFTEKPYARIYVGGPGLDGVVAAHARTEGVATRAIAVTVRDEMGAPVEGAHVHAAGPAGEHLTRATTGADGVATVTVPEGATPELFAWIRGHEVGGPVSAGAGDAAEIVLPASGAVHVVATDATTTTGLPVRVQVVPVDARPELPAAFGEVLPSNGRLHVEFPVGGDVTLPVPPGTHRVVVSRGYEYETVSEEVAVAAGDTAEVAAVLERTVDTTGVMCGDFHIHTHRSPDAEDDATLKLQSALGDGLEIAVRSDHEWIMDFEPLIANLGAEAWAFGVSSLELTTFTWGHFGVFPLDPMPVPNNGAFDWVGKLPPEVFAEVRARSGSQGTASIIINHPRSGAGGLGGIGAYFDAAGYDPDTTMVGKPDHWDEEFVLVEVFNDSDFDANVDGTVRDWFSFLSSGRRVFAVGSSDSHGIRTSPVGYPRTCVQLGTDDPAVLRTMGSGVLRDTMLEGRSSVSGGIYVEAVARGGASLGDTVTGAAAMEMVEVTVRAASFIDADTLRVYADGVLVETIALDDTMVDPLEPTVRFRNTIAVPVADGATPSWVVFVASGDEPLEPLHPGRRPFGVTNPIFFSR